MAECNAVRQALQDLLHEYMNNVSAVDLLDLIIALTPECRRLHISLVLCECGRRACSEWGPTPLTTGSEALGSEGVVVLQTGKAEQSAGLQRAVESMCRKTRDLRRQLRKAVVDHVSDR